MDDAVTGASRARPVRLAARACRDDDVLRAFVEANVSVNAWPILSRPLRRRIRLQGLDLAAAEVFDPPLADLEALMRRFYVSSRRVERMLGIDNAFHHTLHNFDVALRLLLLEWPHDRPMDEDMAAAAGDAYLSFDAIGPLLVELLRRLLGLGVRSARLARDLLAAAGHDYGHSGGPERLDADGELEPMTHEDVAEKHAAKFGMDMGMPAALVLESMAGIRVTTLHLRAGREKIVAANDFERRMMLADVAGCVKRPDLWMTRVAIPVVIERLEPMKHRVGELEREIPRVRRRLAEPAASEAEREGLRRRLAELEAEDAALIKTVTQAIDNELRFLTFIRDHRLAPVPSGRRLWGRTIDERIALVRRQLARTDLLDPLDALGFPFVVAMAERLGNAESMDEALSADAVPAPLRRLYRDFLPAG